MAGCGTIGGMALLCSPFAIPVPRCSDVTAGRRTINRARSAMIVVMR